jgi:hypothetical protein
VTRGEGADPLACDMLRRLWAALAPAGAGAGVEVALVGEVRLSPSVEPFAPIPFQWSLLRLSLSVEPRTPCALLKKRPGLRRAGRRWASRAPTQRPTFARPAGSGCGRCGCGL